MFSEIDGGGLDSLHLPSRFAHVIQERVRMYKIKHDQSMKNAYYVFKDMQHEFCKFSPSFIIRNGIKKNRTFE